MWGLLGLRWEREVVEILTLPLQVLGSRTALPITAPKPPPASFLRPPPHESPSPATNPFCLPVPLQGYEPPPPTALPPSPPGMQTLRTAQAALGKGCLASSFICMYLHTGELYPTEIRWVCGRGRGAPASSWEPLALLVTPAGLLKGQASPALPPGRPWPSGSVQARDTDMPTVL